MKNVYLLLLVLLLGIPAFAGKITGKVSEEKTGETVIGATVLVKGTTNGTTTDIDGNFDLTVTPGSYVLEVKYIGYQTKEIEDVVVTEATAATVNIVLTEASNTTLKEVIVRSSLKKENINALYSIQKNAATISDGISADVIRKSPDRSTGEVLKRVSGTTIQDNKFVIVRGLSDRYNTALIDNSILPSTEPNRKAFSFDIIPAAMIDNIIISKAATPDLPGDFAGGLINILTKEAPDNNFNTLSLGLSYNTVSTGTSFKSGYRTSTDFLGFDNGVRQLPSGFPSLSQIDNSLIAGDNRAKNIGYAQQLNNDFSIKEHTALPGISLQGTLGRSYLLKNGNKFGLTAALTYGHTETIKKDLRREYDNFDYTDNVYTYSSNLGVLLNSGYYFGSNKIVLKALYNRIFDDNFLYREGINYSSSSNIRYYAYDLIQKSLFKTSLEGEHQLGSGQGKLGWLLSYNIVGNNQPDQRKVSYSSLLGSGNAFSADNTSIGKANNRLYGNLDEHIMNGVVNYSLPFSAIGSKQNLKVGVFAQVRTRDFENRYLGLVFNNSIPEDQVRTRDVETLFGNDLIAQGAYDLRDQTGSGDKYEAVATTMAGYAMLDNKLTDRLRLVWGARYEAYSLDLRSEDVHITPKWNDLLPSANITYNLTEKSNLRASYFRSVARPELRETALLSYYDYELNATITGRPNLERSLIDNIDLRYEIYPAAGEILSASVFYKHFDKTLESDVYGENSGYEINPVNYNSARNIGIEAEIRKNLGFIAPNSFLKNLSFYGNFAYISSSVDMTGRKQIIRGEEVKERALSGQSPYVVNTSLSYAALDGKLNFNVLYNRIGQRIFLVGQGRVGNVYEMPRNLLDFQASYNIGKRSEFRLNVKDILNNPVRYYFDQNNNGSFEYQSFSSGHIDSDKDWVLQEYKPGTTMTLTYTYKF